MSLEEFLEYYKIKYETKTQFSTKTDDYSDYLMWSENNFEISIRYNVSSSYKFISITATKDIK